MPRINAQKVLIFDSGQRLLSIFPSAYAAAKTLGISAPAIRKVCVGTLMSCNKMYFRYIPDDIELSSDDIGTLTLREYDHDFCEVERKVYKNTAMSRKGMKYKKHPKPKLSKDELLAKLGIKPLETQK